MAQQIDILKEAMAQYKVPQDVEAEDKLIGPFSFRQFIYLGVVALSIGIGVGLWQIFPGLIIIPLPFAAFFLVLALPLRKDQPMETYLTAVIRFYLKPRKRLWQPEGSIGLVTIVAPRMTPVQLTKSVGGEAAAAQLGYLAQIVDTQGWATRGVLSPTASMNDIAYAEAQQAEDIMDENTHIARTFDSMIDQTSDKYKQSIAERFRAAAHKPQPQAQSQNDSQPAPTATTVSPAPPLSEPVATPQPAPQDDGGNQHLDYNPYPSSMHQHVLRPIDDEPLPPARPVAAQPRPSQQGTAQNMQNTPQPPSREEVSPDIMRLANNNDLSISALANEAHRIAVKDNEEVVINLH